MQAKPLFGTPLNTSHPLSQGMVGCWLFNEGGGTTVYDSLNKYHGTLAGSTLPTWVTGPYGSSLQFPYDGSHTSYVTIPHLGFSNAALTPISYIFAVTPIASTGGNQYYVDMKANWFATYNGYNPYSINQYNGAYNNGPTITYGINYLVVSTIDALGNAKLYTANKVFSANAGTGFSSDSVTIGTYGGKTAANEANANIDFFMIWNRVLSSSEAAYLSAFPFAMFDTNINALNPFDPSSSNTLIVAGQLPRRRI